MFFFFFILNFQRYQLFNVKKQTHFSCYHHRPILFPSTILSVIYRWRFERFSTALTKLRCGKLWRPKSAVIPEDFDILSNTCKIHSHLQITRHWPRSALSNNNNNNNNNLFFLTSGNVLFNGILSLAKRLNLFIVYKAFIFVISDGCIMTGKPFIPFFGFGSNMLVFINSTNNNNNNSTLN